MSDPDEQPAAAGQGNDKGPAEQKVREDDDDVTQGPAPIDQLASPERSVVDPKLKVVLRGLMNNELTIPFREPVDYVQLNLPNYPETIKHPMDLGTILKNLENRHYNATDQVLADIALVWDNCILFNGPRHQLSITARKLRDSTNDFYGELCGIPSSKNQNPASTKAMAGGLMPQKVAAGSLKPRYPGSRSMDDPAVRQAAYVALRTLLRLKQSQPFRSPITAPSAATKCDLAELNLTLIFGWLKEGARYSTIDQVRADVEETLGKAKARYPPGSHIRAMADSTAQLANKRFQIAYETLGIRKAKEDDVGQSQMTAPDASPNSTKSPGRTHISGSPMKKHGKARARHDEVYHQFSSTRHDTERESEKQDTMPASGLTTPSSDVAEREMAPVRKLREVEDNGEMRSKMEELYNVQEAEMRDYVASKRKAEELDDTSDEEGSEQEDAFDDGQLPSRFERLLRDSACERGQLERQDTRAAQNKPKPKRRRTEDPLHSGTMADVEKAEATSLKAGPAREAVLLALRTVIRTRNAQPFRDAKDERSASRCDLETLSLGMIFDRVKDGKIYKTVGDVRRDVDRVYQDVEMKYSPDEKFFQMGRDSKSLMDKRFRILYATICPTSVRVAPIELAPVNAQAPQAVAGNMASSSITAAQHYIPRRGDPLPIQAPAAVSAPAAGTAALPERVPVPVPPSRFDLARSYGLARKAFGMNEIFFERCIRRDSVTARWACRLSETQEKITIIAFNDPRLVPNSFYANGSMPAGYQRAVQQSFVEMTRKLATLTHPGLLHYQDCIAVPGFPFCLVTATAAQHFSSLEPKLRSGTDPTRFTLQDTLAIGRCLARSLIGLHEAGYVHGGVRPGNILVDLAGLNAVLVNHCLPAFRQLALGVPEIVQEEMECCAPETCSGSAATSKTDVFCLGMVLYEMATGEHLLGSCTGLEFVSRMGKFSSPVFQESEYLPLDFRDLIEECLSRKPEKRPEIAKVAARLSAIELTSPWFGVL